jgi:hypothetical protein
MTSPDRIKHPALFLDEDEPVSIYDDLGGRVPQEISWDSKRAMVAAELGGPKMKKEVEAEVARLQDHETYKEINRMTGPIVHSPEQIAMNIRGVALARAAIKSAAKSPD